MFASFAELAGVVARFSERRIAVVGDLIADEYVYGRAERVSREAPVIIVRHERSEIRPGGAGNAALNLRALGADVSLVAAVGTDTPGKQVTRSLGRAGIGVSRLLRCRGWPTQTKTRVLAGDIDTARQQVLRIDKTSSVCPDSGIARKFVEQLERAARRADVIVVSDYGAGVVCGEVISALNNMSMDGWFVAVDSRHNLAAFHSPWLTTPNEPELREATGMAVDEKDQVCAAARALMRKLRSGIVLATRGSKGMLLLCRGKPPLCIPVFGRVEVTDVTGAGDTVIAAFSLALASGASPPVAAVLSAAAASVVVTKSGTATASKAELLSIIEQFAPKGVHLH